MCTQISTRWGKIVWLEKTLWKGTLHKHLELPRQNTLEVKHFPRMNESIGCRLYVFSCALLHH